MPIIDDPIEQRKKALLGRLSARGGKRNVAGGQKFGRAMGRGAPLMAGAGGNRFNRPFGSGGTLPGFPGGPQGAAMAIQARQGLGPAAGPFSAEDPVEGLPPSWNPALPATGDAMAAIGQQPGTPGLEMNPLWGLLHAQGLGHLLHPNAFNNVPTQQLGQYGAY